MKRMDRKRKRGWGLAWPLRGGEGREKEGRKRNGKGEEGQE